MTEVISQRYQWIKGDNQGTVETFDSEAGKFNVFGSGARCNKEIMSEYMIPIYDNSEILSFPDLQKEEMIEKAKINAKRSRIIQGIKTEEEVQSITPKHIVSKPTKTEDSPLISLISKSKKSKIKLNTRIDMALPTKQVLEVLQESFDDDILDVLSKYIVSNIKDPKSYLEKRIKASIKDWFGKKTG